MDVLIAPHGAASCLYRYGFMSTTRDRAIAMHCAPPPLRSGCRRRGRKTACLFTVHRMCAVVWLCEGADAGTEDDSSSGAGALGLVFEMHQGLVDRGASLDWLSQYPHEAEVLWGPLTGMQVLQTRA